MKRWEKLLKDCDGASMVEYALLVSLIALVCFVAVGSVGQNLLGLFNRAAEGIGS